MAAVSTNYGTAGDSNLESNASESRSGASKDSKSGPGSRSGSLSRVQRKRAGTSSRTRGARAGVQRSPSKEGICWDVERRGFGNSDARRVDDSLRIEDLLQRAPPFRIPIRRSLFSLGFGPSRYSSAGADKGRRETRGAHSAPVDASAIELPHLHRPRTRTEGDGPSDAVDPERMVIRKEVEYSIEYEYDEAPRREQDCSKEGSSDAMVYVY